MVESADAHSRLLIPTELTAEASTMLLGGKADGIEAVQHKIAAALQEQGVSGRAAGDLADRWVKSFVEGVGASETPEASMAQASRLVNATAARMAEAAGDATPPTAEQRLMTALTQGPDIAGPATAPAGPAPLDRALFDGVMDRLSRPAGSADPISALSQALNDVPSEPPAPAPVLLSPAEKLAQALASGGAVPEAIQALGPNASADFMSDVERALSSGGDVESSIATAATRSGQAESLARTAAVETSGGDRLLTALASGQGDAVPAAGGSHGGAFLGTLNDALARGAMPDTALGASAKAQADMTALMDGAAAASKPGDAMTAALASGRNVAETVTSFAAAAGVDPAVAGDFGRALGAALSSGSDAANALGAAQQNAVATASVLSSAAQGVKSDPLMAALASGENVSSAVQALGGSGAFSAALGQALASGQPFGQAMAAARQAADTAQHNAQQTAVPMSAEDKAMADLATPKAQDGPAPDAAPEQVADAKDAKETTKDAAKDGDTAKEDAEKPAADGQATGEGAVKAEEGAPKDTAAAEKADSGDKPAADAPAAAKADAPKMVDLAAFTPATGKSGAAAAGGAPGAPAAPPVGGGTAPSAKTASVADPFSLPPSNVVQTVTKAVTATPGDMLTPAPVAAPGFDAAAFAKALAIAEGTAAPAGFTVFHLIEAMFRPGTADGTVIGLAVVANPGSPVGVWQYSVDGSAWQAVGTVGDGAALVLPGRALLRFLPADDMSGTAPALGVRALNESWSGGFSGTGKTLFALTEVGGTSPVSADAVALSLQVTPVNDAPVATGTAAVLGTIAEDIVSPAGASVSSLVGGLFSDAADAVAEGTSANGLAGVAVVGNAATAAQGVWQYWDGSAWAAVGTVSEGSALLVGAGALLRFVPAADWNGTTPALTVRLVDDSSGAIATGARVSLAGGVGLATPYSAATIALTQTVTAVNDAPVATGTTATLDAIAEDSASPAGATVASLFGTLFSDAADAVAGGSSAHALAGVAIVGNAAAAEQGVWQYWNGAGWRAVGSVSDGAALIVAAADKLRFLPSAEWNGTVPALTVRLVDGSGGALQTGGHVDLTGAGVGGTTAYSATTIALNSSVTPVNDAPVATGTAATLGAIAEDTVSPAGASVSSLVGGLFSDAVDGVSGGSSSHALAGVAVVGNAATATQGVWQYWSGSAWTAVGTVSEGSALLVGAGALLRFVPAADWNGTTPALTVRLVDDSSGAIATGARVSLAGGVGLATPYSAATIALTQTVTAVNDAPVATGTTATLDAIAEDTASPAGATVASLFGTLFSDAADAVAGGSSAHALAGVAIVGNAATATQGVWQYWNGSAWAAIGSVSDGAALIMTAADTLRFVPASDWNGTAPALTVRLIDGSGGAVTSRAVVDLTATGVGGATAYSAATVALTQEVTPVNDAPAVATATASLTTVKGVAVAVTGLSVSDIDAGSAPVLVTLTAGHGTLTLADGGTDAVITGSGTGTVTIRATVATINALLAATDGLKYTAASYTGADTVTVVVDDQGGSGTGSALTATAAVAVTVVPPNASPVLLDTALAVSTAAEASAVPTAGTVGIAVSSLVGLNGAGTANVTDGDSGAVTGIALVGTHETYGHWWFSTDGGASWALVGTVNDTDAALLLRPADRLYFQPNAAVPETVSGALTIRAWDQTTGTHGTKATVDTSAGSAFSGQTDTVTLHPAVLVANGSFDHGLTGWLSTGGASATTGGDGHQGTLTSAVGKTSGELETYLGLSTGAIAAAVGATPSAGHAMKLASTITVTKDTTLSFDWSFAFSDTGYFDFGFVSVNGTVTLLAKAESKSGTFHVVIPANTTVSLGFGVSDTTDNSVNPVLTVDNIRLTTVASDPIVLDMTGHGLSLRPLSDGVRFDVTGDGVADQTGWIGAGNALLARDTNHDGRIDSAHELVSEKFGTGFNSSLEALASLDGNHDGRIDAADADYGTLLVWQDADGDGVSRPGELKTLAQAGIASIMTTATPTDASVAGNRVLGTTSMTMADGTQHEVAGVSFDVKAGVDGVVQSHAAGPGTPDSGIGGSDFAAMLRTALGTPHPAATPQDPAGTEASAWVADTHDSGTYPHPPGDTQVAYSPH